jgi:glycogen operon protein
MLNAYWESLNFQLPPLGQGEKWHRVIDTAGQLSEAACDLDAEAAVESETYRVQARSAVVLIVKPV